MVPRKNKMVVGNGFEPLIRQQLEKVRIYWVYNVVKHG